MPVRIYEIAKRLGIESKEVLSKAKELGIAAAKVPSSSLDKITAEFLEEKLGGKENRRGPRAAAAKPADRCRGRATSIPAARGSATTRSHFGNYRPDRDCHDTCARGTSGSRD